MHTVGRWALRVPDGSDGPPNVPLWMDRLAVDLTDVAKDNQGTLAARPASTVVAPGTSGRYFTTTDEDDPAGVDRRRVYRDAGTEWDELATVPLTDRMVGAAQLTEAKMAAGATGLARGAFSVYRAAAVSYTTGSIIQFDTDTGSGFDVSNWYDPATGRFTPLTGVPCIFSFSWHASSSGTLAADNYWGADLWKNGAQHKAGQYGHQRGVAIGATTAGCAISVLANGTTDYFDIRIAHNKGSAEALGVGPIGTWFQGALVGRA